MTKHYFAWFVIVIVVVYFLKKFIFNGPSQPPTPIEPAGPSDIGSMSTLHIRTRFVPVRDDDTVPPDTLAIGSELEKLSQLHTAGSLTDEEFAQAKDQLLQGKGVASSAPVSLIMTEISSNKIIAIQAIRETLNGIDLSQAKQIVDGLPTPQTLFKGLSQADALRIKKYLNTAGIKIVLR